MAGEWDKFVYGPTKKEDEPARVSSSWDDFVTPAPAPKSGITSNQIASSIDRYQAGLYGVGEAVAGAVGAKGSEEWLRKQREENESQADIAAKRARDQGAIDEWKNVHGIKDFGSYTKSLAIQSLPYAAEALVGGAAGRAIGGTARAALAGGVAASYPSAVGDVLSNQREQNGTTNLLAAGALGVPYAALNAVGIESAFMKGQLFRNTVNLLDRPGGIGGALGRTAATATGVGLKEGASETGQEMINQLGRMAVDDKAQFFSDEALDRYKESFIGGAVLGGVTGGWNWPVVIGVLT